MKVSLSHHARKVCVYINTIRREKIRDFVETNQIVTLEQLSDLFPDISLMTIHRDLTWLQEQGFLIKIRGGARYIANIANEPIFAAREIINKNAKNIIAHKAVKFISGSGSLFIDAGTTTTAFVKLLPDMQLNIVTTGPNIAMELAKNQSMTINMCGGVLNKNNLTLSGDMAMNCIAGINIDTAFIAASGYSGLAGFTCGMESEAQIKRLVIQKSRTVVMLIDSSKFEKLLPYTFANIADCDCIITDLNPAQLSPQIIETAREHNISLL